MKIFYIYSLLFYFNKQFKNNLILLSEDICISKNNTNLKLNSIFNSLYSNYSFH